MYHEVKTLFSTILLPLAPCLTSCHDQTGRTVAVVGADISLDWLTGKMNEMDSTLNDNGSQITRKLGIKSHSYILSQDGRFITNVDEERILTDNFFDHIESCDGSNVEGLTDKMKAGIERRNSYNEKYIVDGEECFVFYTPVKYTHWLIVTVVPCRAIDLLGIYKGIVRFIIIMLALLIVVLGYFYIRNGMKPLKYITKSVNDMAEGKFNTAMPEVKHNDEIATLRDAIEKMQYSISNYADKMKS